MAFAIRIIGGLAAASLIPILFVFAFVVPRAAEKLGVPSPDTYSATVPLWLNAQQAWAAGHGLLWSEFQNTGQPLLELPSAALLYPPTWLLTVWELPTLLEWWIVIHLALGGAASWALARSLGQTQFAAGVTAAAFQIASPMLFFALWSPIVTSSYSLMPVAMYACERLLQRRDAVSAVALAGTLALQSTTGYPQILVFTCELVALRVAWEFLTVPSLRTFRALRWLAAAPLLFLLLAAVQIAPALQIHGESVRSIPLPPEYVDLESGRSALQNLARLIGTRTSQGGIFGLVCVLAGGALSLAGARRVTVFYALAAVFFIGLVAETPLRDAYQSLPVVGTLRGSPRFAWITGFCLCILSGFSVDAIRQARSPTRWAALLAGALTGAIGFQLLSEPGWTLREAMITAGIFALGGLVARFTRTTLATAGVVLAGLGLTVQHEVTQPLLRLMEDPEELYTARSVFEIIQERHTNQDRVVIFPSRRAIGGNLGVVEKTPGLYGLPSISDYEHLTPLRYGTFYAYMTSGKMLESAGDWIGALGEAPVHKPMLDLVAGRFVLTTLGVIPLFKPMPLIGPDRSTYRLLMNPRALPRAHFAPQAEVVPNADDALARLASPGHSPLRTVLLEQLPADGWLGSPVPTARRSRVRIASSRGEFVELEVTAPVPGFAVLTDQFFPGWTATVDGESAELLRANYAFRAVRVPAGKSTVRFIYHPQPLLVGAYISGLTVAAMLGFALTAAVRQRRAATDDPRPM